jgi:hypothetical protein
MRCTPLRLGLDDWLEVERRATAAGLEKPAYLRQLVQLALAHERRREALGVLGEAEEPA